MFSATCILVGSLALLEVREAGEARTVNIAEIRAIERDNFDFTRTRIDVVGTRSGDIVTRIPPRHIYAALRACQEPAEAAPAREHYQPPMAPPVNIRSAG